MQVDRKDLEILGALARATIYKKQGTVLARPGVVGERIVTILKSDDGKVETENVVGDGDWVITNPSGEQYVINEKKFLGRYEETGEEGVYAAKGYCRAIANPFGEPIEITASWGEPQFGDENCMIADVCDVDGNMDGEPYLIDGDAFAHTYAPV